MKKLLYAIIFVAVSTCLHSVATAQDEPVLNAAKVPATADKPGDFAPAGWKVEAVAKGDLNGDGQPDAAIKLVEDKPAKDKDDNNVDRARALVIALARSDGKLHRAGVAVNLLQCTGCGGALYGVMEAPADVTIEKGVVIVKQDGGSRETHDETFRFRYDAASGRFLLIGLDYTATDRATGEVDSESTNYVTGARITTRGKGNRRTPTRSQVKPQKLYLDDVDSDKMTSESDARLGG